KEIVDGLIKNDLTTLSMNKKLIKKFLRDLDSTNDNLYNFIRNLDDTSVKGSRFYIISLGYLQDIVENLYVIAGNAHNHVDNNHKLLKEYQGNDLRLVADELGNWYAEVYSLYKRRDFLKLDSTMKQRDQLQKVINDLLDKQIDHIRTTENSPKNSKLYFSILLETNELISSTFKLLRLFKEFEEFKMNNKKQN
ncbi:inorganic phosphate transporter, partial [Sphingobacterium faecium]